MSKPQYVCLTGTKNNAGDYLIKHRGLDLLKHHRPDRELICFDGWKTLTAEQVEVINQSSALILLGGPSLQPHIYPRVFPLVENLDLIRVPIVIMGGGGKGVDAQPGTVARYNFTDASRKLLNKIDQQKCPSGVRDFATLYALRNHSYNRFQMTGCPALYRLDYEQLPSPSAIRTIAFSSGVGFVNSSYLNQLTQLAIKRLKEMFPQARLKVVFHHSLDKDTFVKAYGTLQPIFKKQKAFAAWLTDRDIPFEDISGSVDALISSYSDCDLHVGFRVHAHIYMASSRKPTFLFAEDGRGAALKEVLSGMIIPETCGHMNLATRFGLDRFFNTSTSAEDMVRYMQLRLAHEIESGMPETELVFQHINRHRLTMQQFLKDLP